MNVSKPNLSLSGFVNSHGPSKIESLKATHAYVGPSSIAEYVNRLSLTPDDLSAKILDKLQENPILATITQYVNDLSPLITDIHITSEMLTSVLLANAYYESKLFQWAIAEVSGAPEVDQAISDNPSAYFDKYKEKAKGLFQLIPSSWRGSIKEDLQIDELLNESGILQDISAIDQIYGRAVAKMGHATEFQAQHPASQIYPSVKLLLTNMRYLSNNWTFDPIEGWIPRSNLPHDGNVQTMWNLFPGAKQDKLSGLALIFTIYHCHGKGILNGDHVFIPSFGDRYVNTVLKTLQINKLMEGKV